MAERIHDDEPDTSEPTVRAVLELSCPQWVGLPLEYVDASGTDNAMWRLRVDDGPDLVVRLPRRPGSAARLLDEVAILRAVGRSALTSIVATPRVRHVGEPGAGFPHAWMVLEWLDGRDAWADRRSLVGPAEQALAEDLAAAVASIRDLSLESLPDRQPGQRGGPLGPLLERLDGWLDHPAWHASALIDVDAVRRAAAPARELVDGPIDTGPVHGDLIPGNLLVHEGRLTAIIDWGGTGRGDLAQDLAPAWAVLGPDGRRVFRERLDVDDATWIRAKVTELEHAVGGVLYYVPRRHQLGDVMASTLDRLLGDA